ncbi:ABC transporter ATP-binding protein, partial [Rhizobium ruizarguesonis]
RPRANLQPPRSTRGFILFYSGQVRIPFIAMLVRGGTSAASEAALCGVVGSLVEILGSITLGAGWKGLFAAQGGEWLG